MYLRWHALNVTTPYLSIQPAADAHAEHFAELLGVAPTTLPLPHLQRLRRPQPARPLRPLLHGPSVSRPEMRDQAKQMITWIRNAFERNLPSAWRGWMTRRVQGGCREGVCDVGAGGGSGEQCKWSDYSSVLIRRDRYYDNWYQLQGLRVIEDWQRLTKPSPRAVFSTNPSIVNAFYSPAQNAMIFPAGILVDPFYNGDFPMAMNLGAVGLVMGHELMHGFDNNGRQFDKDGLRRQWWDDNVITAFGTEEPSVSWSSTTTWWCRGRRSTDSSAWVRTSQTTGGCTWPTSPSSGTRSSWRTFNMRGPHVPPSISPLTSEQLFYWAHAQTWCTKATDAAIANAGAQPTCIARGRRGCGHRW